MCVFNGLEDTRACLESLRATTEPFRLVVMDNGSTDGTTEFFTRFPYPYPLTFARSPANDGVIAALNRAWRLADTEVLCFLHNDTELSEPAWLARLLEALAEPRAGRARLRPAPRAGARGPRHGGRGARALRSEVASPPAVRRALRAPADGRLAQDEERTPRRPVDPGLAGPGGMRSDMTNVAGARLVSGRFTQARLARRTRCGFALPRSAPASRAPVE